MRRCLKTASDCVDVMWSGRSFDMLAPATRNARLPTVQQRDDWAVLLDDNADQPVPVPVQASLMDCTAERRLGGTSGR